MFKATLAPASLPPGQRIYAIGDIHGLPERLQAMHRAILADILARPVPEPLVVHLGDYIDRGPDSAGVVEYMLHSLVAAAGLRMVNLMGNHEAMMLDVLAGGDPGMAETWLTNGGCEALESWGVPRRTRPRDWAGYVPPEHQGFLRGLGLLHQAGGYIFVHAGLRPGVPLPRQSRLDMLWIREPFLSFEGKLPGVVVHGHTPVDDPELFPHRIGVDTGAVLGGSLTCAVLEGDQVGFLRS
jgi:serine/threonine protein phosphatase 1